MNINVAFDFIKISCHIGNLIGNESKNSQEKYNQKKDSSYGSQNVRKAQFYVQKVNDWTQ